MKHPQILIRYSCPACHGTGMVKAKDVYDVNLDMLGIHPTKTVKTYDECYCPSCKGEKILEEWKSLAYVIGEVK